MKMPKYEDISPPESPLQKFPLLSPQEMRDVLADLEETDDNQSSPDNKEQFSCLKPLWNQLMLFDNIVTTT